MSESQAGPVSTLLDLLDLPQTDTISRAEVRPGDVIVIETSKNLSEENVKNIQATLRKTFPHGRAIILTGGMKLKIVKASEIDERDAGGPRDPADQSAHAYEGAVRGAAVQPAAVAGKDSQATVQDEAGRPAAVPDVPADAAAQERQDGLGAALAIYFLLFDGEIGAEVYSAASDKDQAALVFNVAAQMIRNEPELLAAVRDHRIAEADRLSREAGASIGRSAPRRTANTASMRRS